MDSPNTIKVGARVRIADVLGKHPHNGKTGIVTELLGVHLTGPNWPPRAFVKLDDGTGIAVVSLRFLEPIT